MVSSVAVLAAAELAAVPGGVLILIITAVGAVRVYAMVCWCCRNETEPPNNCAIFKECPNPIPSDVLTVLGRYCFCGCGGWRLLLLSEVREAIECDSVNSS